MVRALSGTIFRGEQKTLQENTSAGTGESVTSCQFFIGLSSGLSRLAWATHIPVVLISGFTLPVSEFYTPWRIFSSHGCNGCWDDTSLNFDHKDFLWCPRHKNTPRQFECTRLITGKQVNGVIDKLHASRQNKVVLV